MTEKKCFKCGEVKCMSLFYKHNAMSDGHLNKCKECTKNDTKKNRIANIDYYTAYEKQRNKKPHRVEARKKYLALNPEKLREAKLKWNKNNRHKKAAHLRVKRALVKGIMVKKQFCEICGDNGNIEGHPPNYTEPLNVVWVCKKCHTKIHYGEWA